MSNQNQSGSTWSAKDRILSYKAAKIEFLRQQNAAKNIKNSLELTNESIVSITPNSKDLSTETTPSRPADSQANYLVEQLNKGLKISSSQHKDISEKSPNDETEKSANILKTLSQKDLSDEDSNDTLSEDEDIDKIQFSEFPSNGSNIIITSVVRSNLIYIRSMSDNIEYFQVIHLIHHQGKKARKLKKMPEPGDIIITQFKDYSFYRALILRADSPKRIILVYLDFGNVDEKSLDDLYVANQFVINLTCYIFPVYLNNVEDFHVSAVIKSEIESWVSKTELKCLYEGTISTKGPYICDIIDWQETQSLSEKINLLRNFLPLSERLQYYIEPDVIPINGTNISLIILDIVTIQKTKMITCMQSRDIMALQQFNKEIEHYVKQDSNKCYTPRVGELCLVQAFDERWYRGTCVEVLGDGFPTINFIDFGNFSPIHINKIRQYPHHFNFPIVSCDCEVFGLPNTISDKLCNRLKELLPLYTSLVADEVICASDAKMNVVRFDKVIEIIKAEDLLCS